MLVILAPLLPSLVFLFIVAYLFIHNKAAPIFIFLPYGLSCGIQAILILTNDANNKYVIICCLNIFLMAEFLAFCIFIRRQIKKDTASRAMLFFLQLFPMASCYFWMYNDALHELHPFTIIIQFTLITTGCLFYYDEIFEEPPDADLKNNYAFWMINGMLILSCLSVPLSFFMSGQAWQTFLFSIFYFFRFLTFLLLFVLFHTSFKYRINFK
jgi:hypothetical protein